MKRTLLVSVSACFIFAALIGSSLRVTSNSAQPPQTGLAGDPGQTTCNNCHAGSTRTDASKFTLRIALDSADLALPSSIVTSATQYTPNSITWVSLTLNGTNGSTPMYGFQLTALDSANHAAGTFTLTNTARTSMLNNNSTGRKYVGHRNASATINSWSFKWNTPANGPVTFFYSGNIANGDGHEYTPGDSVFDNSATITAGVGVGIHDFTTAMSIARAYPMPVSSALNINLALVQPSPLSMTLITLSGTTIRELYHDDMAEGFFNRTFDLSDVASGVYLVKVQAGATTQVLRVVKL